MSQEHNRTAINAPDGCFPPTEWTKILDVGQRRAIMDELCKRYWKPLYRYLRCRGYCDDVARDMVQGFFTEKILGQDLARRADRARGRFRTFLLVALKNYTINVQRTERSQTARDRETPAVDREGDPEVEFDRAWARGLLQSVLADLQAECEFKRKQQHWQVFNAWLLESDAADSRRPMGDICAQYGIADSATAYNMIANLKRRFRAILRRHLQPLVESESEFEDEIRSLIQSFAK